MKYLLLISIVLVLWWAWRKRSSHSQEGGAAPEKVPEKIVACAHCGVHHPLSESLSEGPQFFCSAAHRAAGKSDLRS